jgi:carboxyl-terminal processing protease
VDKRYFDEEMSGTFYGIGASLQYDDGNIKITSIVTGSPAYKSGELQVGDVIIKVAQGKEEPVDLVGYSVADAVKIIRGKQGTEVKLTVRRQDGSTKQLR